MFSLKTQSNSDACESGCCTPQPKAHALCPKCGKKAKEVLSITLEHLLNVHSKEKLSSLEGFHYCKTASCEVIYFSDETVLTQDDVSVVVGLKEGATPATVCYCFAWTKEKIASELKATGSTTALDDIKVKMENPGCSCETLNPSGKCCLGDVTKMIKALEANY